jgi:hypothetical protein
MVDPALRQVVESEADSYANGAELPLGSFAMFMAAYAAAVAGLGVAVRRSGRALPDRLNWSDVLLMSFATHKIARLVAKDPVTSPVRAPFARFSGTSGPAELAEEVRGRGLRKAIGELITCPFCLGQWIATGLAFGLVLLPRQTRLIAAIFTARTGADFLQFAYSKVQQ